MLGLSRPGYAPFFHSIQSRIVTGRSAAQPAGLTRRPRHTPLDLKLTSQNELARASAESSRAAFSARLDNEPS
jgi:hypothetical protein